MIVDGLNVTQMYFGLTLKRSFVDISCESCARMKIVLWGGTYCHKVPSIGHLYTAFTFHGLC